MEKALDNLANEIVFVALDDKRYIGYGCCIVINSVCYAEPYAELLELYVRENYRQLGVGTALMKSMEDECRKSGVNFFQLATGLNNVKAQSFYEKLGYTRKRICYLKGFMRDRNGKIYYQVTGD